MHWIMLLSTARSGQVHTEVVSLEQALSAARAAVVIELGRPASIAVAVPVPGAPGKDCGTYGYGAWRGTVREVVVPPPASLPLAAGAALNVFPADTSDLVELTRRACVSGGSKSPIYGRFEGAQPADGARLIVLLRWEPPYGWVEAVSGSWLAPAQAERVRAGMAGRPDIGLPVDVAPLLCVLDADCAAPLTCRAMKCGL